MFHSLMVRYMGGTWVALGRHMGGAWEALRTQQEENYAKSLEERKIIITFASDNQLTKCGEGSQYDIMGKTGAPPTR